MITLRSIPRGFHCNLGKVISIKVGDKFENSLSGYGEPQFINLRDCRFITEQCIGPIMCCQQSSYRKKPLKVILQNCYSHFAGELLKREALQFAKESRLQKF